jgi:hypothetical protein
VPTVAAAEFLVSDVQRRRRRVRYPAVGTPNSNLNLNQKMKKSIKITKKIVHDL